MRRPPLLARALVRLLLPRSVRDDFLGDLEERFHRTAAHDVGAARRGFWRDALSPSVIRLRREVRGMPLPPGARPGSATGDGTMHALLQDLKYALRLIAKAPGFTAVAVLSLALGIGPNTAIFSLVDTLLLTDWGVEEPETVMDIYSLTEDGQYFYTYYSVYELVRDGAPDAFTSLGVSAQYSGNIERDGVGELVLGELVSGNYFELLGVSAAAGRTFLPEEDATPGTHPVVVVSDRYWATRYDRDPALVGSEIRLNGRPYTVVGVAPREFRGRIAPGLGTDFWAPLRMYPHLAPGQMGNGNLLILGRLASGVTPDQARARLDAAAARFNEANPERRAQLALGAVTLDEIVLHPNFDSFLLWVAGGLFVAVALVLLVACVNLAGFLLARGTERRKEMAVRVAMGANRGAIIRQLLVESMVLASLGGGLGLLLGLVMVRTLAGINLPFEIPFALDVALNGRLLLFTGGTVIAAAVLFGLAPALESIRSPTAATLRDEAGTAGRKKGSLRGLLVAGQMALSTVLLVAAGLFLRSLQTARGLDVGFDTGPASVVTVEAWASDNPQEVTDAFARELYAEVAALPGVQNAAFVSRLPLDLGVTNSAFEVPGVAPPPDDDFHRLELAYATPGYFETMGIEIVQGRGISEEDRADAQPVVVVSQATADLFWPGQIPLGRTIYRARDPDAAFTVVGVVGSAKIWSLTESPRPYLYFPYEQGFGYGRYHVVARGAGDPVANARRIRDAARALDPEIYLSQVGTMDDHLSYIYFLPRIGAFLLVLVGSLAVLMACVGLYGMVSYSVSRRTREMGIRLALGAQKGSVVGMVVQNGMTVVILGGIVGLAAALGTGTLLQRFLIGVGTFDVLALVAAPLFLLFVAGAAAYLPARRAALVDPAVALRSD